MKDRRPPRWEDPSRVEVGQVWDFIGEGEDITLLVLETREIPPTGLDPNGRRNASAYVLMSSQDDDTRGFQGNILSYSEKHLRSYFKRVS